MDSKGKLKVLKFKKGNPNYCRHELDVNSRIGKGVCYIIVEKDRIGSIPKSFQFVDISTQGEQVFRGYHKAVFDVRSSVCLALASILRND